MKTIVQVQQAFQRIPGVGPSIGADLVDLGVRGLDDLAGRCPEALYRDLIDLRRAEIDRCVLYVFAALFILQRRLIPMLKN